MSDDQNPTGVDEEPAPEDGSGKKVTLSPEQAARVRESFAGLNEVLRKSVGRIVAPIATPILPDFSAIRRIEERPIPTLGLDPERMAPNRTAKATEQMAEYTADMLAAMRESVLLAEQTRADNVAASVFTRRISIASLIIAAVSLIAGLASVLVAVLRP